MTDCEYCHKEINKDDDFILVGKFPSAWQKWKDVRFNFHSYGQVSQKTLERFTIKPVFLK